MSATLESKATDLAADIGKLGATALRIKEERDELAAALRSALGLIRIHGNSKVNAIVSAALHRVQS